MEKKLTKWANQGVKSRWVAMAVFGGLMSLKLPQMGCNLVDCCGNVLRFMDG